MQVTFHSIIDVKITQEVPEERAKDIISEEEHIQALRELICDEATFMGAIGSVEMKYCKRRIKQC